MPESNPTSSNWLKVFFIAVLLGGTFLFFYQHFSQGPDWESLRNSAIEQYQQGNLMEAERLLVSTLEIAEEFAEKDSRRHQSLRDLIEIYNLQSKHSEAGEIILRLIALDTKLLGPDHPNVAASLNNLAENYRVRGNSDKADEAYRQSLEILEKRFGPDHEFVAHVRNGYHQFLRETGKPIPNAGTEDSSDVIQNGDG